MNKGSIQMERFHGSFAAQIARVTAQTFNSWLKNAQTNNFRLKNARAKILNAPAVVAQRKNTNRQFQASLT